MMFLTFYQRDFSVQPQSSVVLCSPSKAIKNNYTILCFVTPIILLRVKCFNGNIYTVYYFHMDSIQKCGEIRLPHARKRMSPDKNLTIYKWGSIKICNRFALLLSGCLLHYSTKKHHTRTNVRRIQTNLSVIEDACESHPVRGFNRIILICIRSYIRYILPVPKW